MPTATYEAPQGWPLDTGKILVTARIWSELASSDDIYSGYVLCLVDPQQFDGHTLPPLGFVFAPVDRSLGKADLAAAVSSYQAWNLIYYADCVITAHPMLYDELVTEARVYTGGADNLIDIPGQTQSQSHTEI